MQQFESAFVQEVLDKANEEHEFSVQKAKKDVVVLKSRFENLDLLFKRVNGVERFGKQRVRIVLAVVADI